MIIKHTFKLVFQASNNQTKYKALGLGLTTAKQLGVNRLQAFSDSQLVVRQVNGSYEAKDPKMAQYLKVIQNLMCHFCEIEISQISREDNSHAYALTHMVTVADVLTSTSNQVELLEAPSIYHDSPSRRRCELDGSLL